MLYFQTITNMATLRNFVAGFWRHVDSSADAKVLEKLTASFFRTEVLATTD
jgi:hypothetical protein